MAGREVEGPAGRPRQADAETGGTAASARCRLMAQSYDCVHCGHYVLDDPSHFYACQRCVSADETLEVAGIVQQDRKSTRLNSSHQIISYAVFCLQKKKHATTRPRPARRQSPT